MTTKSATIMLSDVARELKMDPKTARQKLRRAQDAGRPHPEPTSYDNWEFPAVAKSALVKFLKGNARTKETKSGKSAA